MSTSPASEAAPAASAGDVSETTKLLLIAEAGCMFAFNWLTRPFERIAPRLALWSDIWLGRMLKKFETVQAPYDSDRTTKEVHG